MYVLNILLFFLYLGNPPVYEQFKAAGAPCYAYISDHGEAPDAPPPPCFYDPLAQ